MFSARQELWSDSSSHVEGWLYDPIILALLRDCTCESMDSRPHFQALQYHFCARLLFSTLLFLFIQIIKIYFYHPYYTCITISSPNQCTYTIYHCIGCVGDTRDSLFFWLQGCLRETIFILRLLRIDKPYVIHLREICYCPTNLYTWRPNNVYKKKVVYQTSSSFLAPLPGR